MTLPRRLAIMWLLYVWLTAPAYGHPEPAQQLEYLEFLSADFFQSSLSVAEKQWLAEHPKLRLGVDHAWAPFEYFDEQRRYSGVASGYVKLLEAMLNTEFNAVYNRSWPAVIEQAKSKRLDVLPAVAITPERQQFLNFTEPYISFPTVIATRHQSDFVGSIEDLHGQRVAVVKAYATQENLARDHQKLVLVPYDTLEEALVALANAEVDALVDNLAAISYGLNKLQIDNVQVAAQTDYTFELRMGVRKDWPELVAILNKALAEIPPSKRSSITNQWVSIYIDEGLNLSTVLMWVLPTLSVVLIALYGFVRGNRRLREEVLERKRAELEYKKLSAAVEQSPVSIMITDTKGIVEYVNPRFYHVTGFKPEEVIGQHTRMFNSGKTPSETYRDLWATIRRGEIWRGEFHNKKKNGEYYWEVASICPITNEAGEIVSFISTREDITSLKEEQAVILKQATTDGLTGLPNRMLFQDRLSQAVSSSRRQTQQFAMIYIDLDNFKKINDTLGHSAGDEYLVEISKRFQSCIRSSDTLARLGGDEFVVLLLNISKTSDVKTIASHLLQSLNESIVLNRSEYYASCSMGICMYPDDAEDPELLMKYADMAMYQAKDLGRNNFQFFSEELNQRAMAHITLENELHTAIDEQQFRVFYQPIVALKTNKVVSAEALVRWQHPERGLLAPDAFIAVAEETGLIAPIGHWVLEQACSDFKRFNPLTEGLEHISVNCSPKQFQHAVFFDEVCDVIERAQLRPEQLVLEITENLFIDAADSMSVSMLEELREFGVLVSMDDFGTGYSSLGYLRRFPVDILKIDRSFMFEVLDNLGAQQLVDTIVKMAHALELTVVAEGIENAQTAYLLKTMGCDCAQGYYYAKPLSADDFMHFLETEQDTGMSRYLV